jgi:hypothetical protein
VRARLVAAARPDEDAVQDHQVLVDGPVREPFLDQGVAEALDRLLGHLLQAELRPELLAEDLLHPVGHVLVVDLGRELDLAVALVGEPVVAGGGEGRAGADHPPVPPSLSLSRANSICPARQNFVPACLARLRDKLWDKELGSRRLWPTKTKKPKTPHLRGFREIPLTEHKTRWRGSLLIPFRWHGSATR